MGSHTTELLRLQRGMGREGRQALLFGVAIGWRSRDGVAGHLTANRAAGPVIPKRHPRVPNRRVDQLCLGGASDLPHEFEIPLTFFGGSRSDLIHTPF